MIVIQNREADDLSDLERALKRIAEMTDLRDAVSAERQLTILHAHQLGATHETIAESAFTSEADIRHIITHLKRDEDLPDYDDTLTWTETRRHPSLRLA